MNTAPPVGTVVVDLSRTGMIDSTAGDDATATVTAVLDGGEAVALTYFDGTTNGYVEGLSLGRAADLGCVGNWGPCHDFGDRDTAQLRPDAAVTCRFCGVMTTGADYASSRGVVLMTKSAAPYVVVALDRDRTWKPVGFAGTAAEMTSAVHAAGADRLRRGRILPAAAEAEGWDLFLDVDRVVYSPARPGTVGLAASRR